VYGCCDALFENPDTSHWRLVDLVLHVSPEEVIRGSKIRRSWSSCQWAITSNPPVWKCLVQKLPYSKCPVWRRTILLEDKTFPNRWIGRDGPLAWAPRSSDLTPPDYFLWGYMKDQIYKTPVQSIRVLKERITSAAIHSVTPEMLQNVWREIEVRLDTC
jgi:hypothetical protein